MILYQIANRYALQREEKDKTYAYWYLAYLKDALLCFENFAYNKSTEDWDFWGTERGLPADAPQIVLVGNGGPTLYTVKAGDSLKFIAELKGFTIKELRELNPNLAKTSDDADLHKLGITKIKTPKKRKAKRKQPKTDGKQLSFSFETGKTEQENPQITIRNGTNESNTNYTGPSTENTYDEAKHKESLKQLPVEPEEPPFDWWAVVSVVADVLAEVVKEVVLEATGLNKVIAVWDLAVAIVEGDEDNIKKAIINLATQVVPLLGKAIDLVETGKAIYEASKGNYEPLKDKILEKVIEKGSEKIIKKIDDATEKYREKFKKILQEADPNNNNIVVTEKTEIKNKEYNQVKNGKTFFKNYKKKSTAKTETTKTKKPAETKTETPNTEKIEINPTKIEPDKQLSVAELTDDNRERVLAADNTKTEEPQKKVVYETPKPQEKKTNEEKNGNSGFVYPNQKNSLIDLKIKRLENGGKLEGQDVVKENDLMGQVYANQPQEAKELNDIIESSASNEEKIKSLNKLRPANKIAKPNKKQPIQGKKGAINCTSHAKSIAQLLEDKKKNGQIVNIQQDIFSKDAYPYLTDVETNKKDLDFFTDDKGVFNAQGAKISGYTTFGAFTIRLEQEDLGFEAMKLDISTLHEKTKKPVTGKLRGSDIRKIVGSQKPIKEGEMVSFEKGVQNLSEQLYTSAKNGDSYVIILRQQQFENGAVQQSKLVGHTFNILKQDDKLYIIDGQDEKSLLLYNSDPKVGLSAKEISDLKGYLKSFEDHNTNYVNIYKAK